MKRCANTLLPLAIVGAMAAGCGHETKQNIQYVECNGLPPEELGIACEQLNAHLQHDISYYINQDTGDYHFQDVFWDTNVQFTQGDEYPPGRANIVVRRGFDESGETQLEAEITDVQINSDLGEEIQSFVLEKEVVGHAKAISFVLETHPELLEEDDTFGDMILFVDRLSHLALDESKLRAIGFGVGYGEHIPYWDGSFQLSEDVLDFLSEWNSQEMRSGGQARDIRWLIDLYRE